MVFLYVIISLVIAAGLLAWRDLPILSGAILASGAGERYGVRFFSPVIILAGLALPAIFPDLEDIFRMPVPAMVKNLLPVGIATLVAVLTVFRFSRFPAVSFAFMGALYGLGLASGDAPGIPETLPYIYSWLAAPLLCALLAAGIYRIYSLHMRSRKTHMAVMEGRVLCAATLTAPLLLASAAYNNSPVFTCLLHGGGYAGAAIAAVCALLGWLAVRGRSVRAKWNIADYELDTNSITILALMLAMLLLIPANLPLALAELAEDFTAMGEVSDAAQIAMEAGFDMAIINGRRPENLYDFMDGIFREDIVDLRTSGSDITWCVFSCHVSDDCFCLFCVTWDKDIQVGQISHNGNIFQSLVGYTIFSNGNAAMGADDLDIELRIDNTVADLFPCSAGAEHGKGGKKGHIAACCQSGCHTDHVIFGNAHFKESFRCHVFCFYRLRTAGQIGIQYDDFRVFLYQLGNRFSICFTGCFCHNTVLLCFLHSTPIIPVFPN